MNALRSLVGAVTALAFFVQMTGLAHADPPQAEAPPSPPPPPGSAPLPPARPGGDAIYLTDGGMLRGTLLEMLPNDHATIQLPTGQNAIVRWSKIERIERQYQAPPAGVFLPPAVAGSAFVHMDADPGVTLESIAPGSGRWELACTTPCDAELPLADQYRIGGPNVRRSRPFEITASPGQHVVLTVSAGSKGAFAGGIALAAGGGAAAGIGLVILTFAALECGDGDSFECDEGMSPNSGLEIAGAVVMLAGVGMLIGGAILAASSKTTETQTMAALTPKARPDTAWLRAPMWHDTVRDTPGMPKAIGFPIFEQRF